MSFASLIKQKEAENKKVYKEWKEKEESCKNFVGCGRAYTLQNAYFANGRKIGDLKRKEEKRIKDLQIKKEIDAKALKEKLEKEKLQKAIQIQQAEEKKQRELDLKIQQEAVKKEKQRVKNEDMRKLVVGVGIIGGLTLFMLKK